MKGISLFILALIVTCKGLQAQQKVTGGLSIITFLIKNLNIGNCSNHIRYFIFLQFNLFTVKKRTVRVKKYLLWYFSYINLYPSSIQFII